MLNALKTINLALAFLLELAMLAAFGYWGYAAGRTPPLNMLLAAGLPLLAAVFWGLFMAPRAARRLAGAAYLVVKCGLFALAAAGLFAAGRPGLAIALAGTFVGNIIVEKIC